MKTFDEQYEVSLDYQKPEGSWVHNAKLLVTVSVVHKADEKCNHDKAAQIASEKYKGCRINSVKYV